MKKEEGFEQPSARRGRKGANHHRKGYPGGQIGEKK
jgi:ribosomal protein S21